MNTPTVLVAASHTLWRWSCCNPADKGNLYPSPAKRSLVQVSLCFWWETRGRDMFGCLRVCKKRQTKRDGGYLMNIINVLQMVLEWMMGEWEDEEHWEERWRIRRVCAVTCFLTHFELCMWLSGAKLFFHWLSGPGICTALCRSVNPLYLIACLSACLTTKLTRVEQTEMKAWWTEGTTLHCAAVSFTHGYWGLSCVFDHVGWTLLTNKPLIYFVLS